MTASNVRAAVVATVAMLLACGAAHAAEWVPIGQSKDGKSIGYVDAASIKIEGIFRHVWLKIIVPPHKEKGVGSASKKWITHTLTRMNFDCGDGTSLIESALIYFEDGTSTNVPATEIPAGWQPVPPDSGYYNTMDFTCSWKPTAQSGDPPSQNGDPHLSDVYRSTPAQPIKTIQLPDCHKDYYPSQALRLHQQGAVVVRFCIGVNNKIDGPVEVVTSSGFPLLDEAAGKCVGAGSYEAAVINGAPARTCKALRVQYASP